MKVSVLKALRLYALKRPGMLGRQEVKHSIPIFLMMYHQHIFSLGK